MLYAADASFGIRADGFAHRRFRARSTKEQWEQVEDRPEPFLMWVEDVFTHSQGRALLVTGRIERGRVRVGDDVEVVGGRGGGVPVRVAGIEGPGGGTSRTARAGQADAGTNVGLLLPGSVESLVERGQVLARPRSIGAYGTFHADIALSVEAEAEERGGAQIRTGDQCTFHFGSDGVRGTVTLPPGTDVLHPLHTARVTVTLGGAVALENGWPFTFRFRGRAAGAGTVTALIEAAPRVAP